MSGRDYLAAIKSELEAGHHQNRMGESLLAAFGYVRRRQTAIDEINATLAELGLVTDPSIGPNMPLRSPRIKFSLGVSEATTTEPSAADETEPLEEEASDPDVVSSTQVSTFRVAELAAADKPVGWINPNASVAAAYTKMSLNKFSQLVVAGSANPRQQDIKGIVSYESIAKALLKGAATEVRQCIDDSVPTVNADADLKDVVPRLAAHDVVLVVGHDHRLQGIVTAWDLAEEFAQLVDPFKRIGEIEARLRAVVENKLGLDGVNSFLAAHPPTATEQHDGISELTIGELQRVLSSADNWEHVGLPGLDRSTFVAALDRMRLFRNRLMHFKDPLTEEETQELSRLCDLVREIQV